MTKIVSQCPTRVDLAGGTLDLWPIYLFHKDCVTVNLAIDIFTRATITSRKDKKIILESRDNGIKKEFANLEELKRDNNQDLKLLKVHGEFWQPKQGFDLLTESESPIGAGIAGSSSLNIALCGAFSKLTGRKLDPMSLIRLAGNLEAKVIHSPTGCQDYFPAYFGGLSFVDLTSLGPQHHSGKIPLKEFADRFTLIYTGRPHHSGLNNWQIFKGHMEGNREIYARMEKVRDVAIEMKQACHNKDINSLGDLFKKEYDARVELSPVFTSPEIERLKNISQKFGGEAIKICGAGGGGCVFLWSDPSKKRILEKECVREGFQVLQQNPQIGVSKSK